MSRRVAIAGIALSDVGRVDNATPYALMAQASRRALADAGLRPDQIDGFASTGLGTMAPVDVAEYMGIVPRWVDSTTVGGSSWEVMAAHAADAISAGHADVILLAYGSTARADLRKGLRTANLDWGARGPMQWEAPYGHTLISKYAMAARRHMHEYGTTIEQLAEIAVSARFNAGPNPEAFVRDPITIADVLDGPMIADPFTKLQCCIRSDGAAAVILVAEDRVADLPAQAGLDPRHRRGDLARLDGAVGRLHDRPGRGRGPDGLRARRRHPGRRRRVRALRRVHLHAADHARRPRVLRQGRGRALRRGRQAPPRRGAAHQHRRRRAVGLPSRPARPVPDRRGDRQLRGEAGDRQVPDAEIACVSGTGGWFCSNGTMMLGAG